MFLVLLDTCVLWPSLQRDFLLSLAVEGVYRPAWSSTILAELEFHETRKLMRRGTDRRTAARRARWLVEQMRKAFLDAEVQGWEALVGTYGLPDPDDEHVVAAAVVAGAGAIVTHNIKDFPAERLPTGLQVLDPVEFAEATVSLDPVSARRAVSAIARRSGRMGVEMAEGEILDLLARRYGMTHLVQWIRFGE
ncbi:PIN domain-containing protein [Polymorphospora sp. NPDC051019]|uniref:PIN domain-containing protein n=1 Tax=Polymorphospora sp. NPDC051019 TaxID=3155725 RepID=UPI0034379224